MSSEYVDHDWLTIRGRDAVCRTDAAGSCSVYIEQGGLLLVLSFDCLRDAMRAARSYHRAGHPTTVEVDIPRFVGPDPFASTENKEASCVVSPARERAA